MAPDRPVNACFMPGPRGDRLLRCPGGGGEDGGGGWKEDCHFVRGAFPALETRRLCCNIPCMRWSMPFETESAYRAARTGLRVLCIHVAAEAALRPPLRWLGAFISAATLARICSCVIICTLPRRLCHSAWEPSRRVPASRSDGGLAPVAMPPLRGCHAACDCRGPGATAATGLA